MNEKKHLVPSCRFPEYEGSMEWKVALVKDVCFIGTGKSNSQDQDENGKYPFFIRSENPVKSKRYLYDCEAVITIGDGKIGKVFHYVNGKFDLHQRCYRMTDFNGVNGKFFYYFFSSHFYDRAMRMTAKATVDSVRLEMISEMPIYFPSISEQEKIANCLSSIDSCIASINEKIEQLKAHKKGLMQKLFPQNGKTVPEYRFPEFEKDEGWTEKRLGDFIKVRNGYAFKSNTYITSGKFKIVTIRNVKKGRLEMGEYNTINNLPTDIQPHQILKRGNILVSMTGNVGRVCKVDCDNCLQNQRVGLIEKYTTTIDEDFVFTILTDACFEQAMIESGQGAAQTNIGNKDIEDYSFLCPPSLSEQNQIALCLSPIESLTSYYMDKVALLEQFMVGLTQQLFPKQQAL